MKALSLLESVERVSNGECPIKKLALPRGQSQARDGAREAKLRDGNSHTSDVTYHAFATLTSAPSRTIESCMVQTPAFGVDLLPSPCDIRL